MPARIELRTQLCRITLDFTQAVITSNVVQVQTDLLHGKLVLTTRPGIVIDADRLTLTYSKVKLRSGNAIADPQLRIELVGNLLHSRVIQR